MNEKTKEREDQNEARRSPDLSASPAVVGTSSSTTKILDCPFCGAKGIVDKVDHGINDYYYRIKCDSDYEHKLDWWEDTENEAIAVWNMRA